jgi:anthranilate synthase component 1
MTIESRRLHADLETPVSAYLKLASGRGPSFLYESVEGRERWATYSILGVGARRVFRAQDGVLIVAKGDSETRIAETDSLSALRAALDAEPLSTARGAPPFVGGIFGYLAYDAVRGFERLPGVPGEPEVPDLHFFEPEIVAVFDNQRYSLTLYGADQASLDAAIGRLRGPLPERPAPTQWQEPTACDAAPAFCDAVEVAKEHIRAGDVIQAVLSRRFEMPRIADPFDVYRGLRTINPSPYLFYLDLDDVQIAGASPEVMLRVLDGRVTVRPIAGTRPRGASEAEDERLADELLADPKERAEHIMLVDLGRNDVGRVSAPGTVEVTDLMIVERYSHVMHIVSEVQGTLASDLDATDALRAAFPAGTLSGAPKVRAMEIIDGLEQRRRGIYGGAVGYFGPGGDADFGIAIRTLVARPNRFIVQAGAGIVADSVPQREAEETEHKARAVFRAVEWAVAGAGR